MVANSINRMSDQFQDAMGRPVQMVQEHPLPAMMLMFGIGLGVGVLVGQTLSGSFQEMAEEPSMTEKMRRQVFDALSHVLTPSMMQQVKHYAS